MKKFPLARTVAPLLCLALASLACQQRPPTTTPPGDPNLPVIFVHGYLGSGEQYRSEALRWASNGFPIEKVRVFNYNTATVNSSGLNAFVDRVRTEFGVSKVNIVGHSLGTSVVSSYATANAGKVSRFVLVDGVGCPTGAANCLVIRAADMGQTHVESTTSAESFDRQYRFFTGKAPATTAIVPQTGPISIAGYALDLQTNVPESGAAAQVWEVDPSTGQRVGASPAGTFTVRSDGGWGPVTVTSGKPYEITASRSGMTVHYYFQPFVRSDNLIHLIGAPQTSPQETNTNRSPNHVTMVVQRQREFWRSHGARNDTLTIGSGGPAANVFQNVATDVIAVHVQDDKATPGVSSLGLLNYFKSQAFQTGVDVYVPASPSASGTVTITNVPRGDASKTQRIAVPNWPSNANHVIVEFNDWVS